MKLQLISRYLPIGLDVGARTIKAAQAVLTRSGPRLASVAVIPRVRPNQDLDAEGARRVMDAVWRQGFKGRDVVVAVPADRLLSGAQELPPRSSGAPLDMIARAELARVHKCDPGKMESAWWELPAASNARPGDRTQVLSVGCRHEDAAALMDALESAGAAVTAIDAAPVALARACRPMVEPAPRLTAVVDLGWNAAQLLVLHGATPVYERTIREIGTRHLHAGLAGRMQIDDELTEHVLRCIGCAPSEAAPADPDGRQGLEQADEVRGIVAAHADAIATEVRASAAYAGRRFDAALSRVLIAGGGAAIPGLAEAIGRRADLDSRPARADALCPALRALDTEAAGPGAVLALGLALHAAPVMDHPAPAAAGAPAGGAA